MVPPVLKDAWDFVVAGLVRGSVRRTVVICLLRAHFVSVDVGTWV